MDSSSSSPALYFHPTHVAGTMIAAGLNPLAKGMAYVGRIRAWKADNDLTEMSQAAGSNLVFVSNHSYGYPIGWQLLDDYWELEGDSTQSLAWEDRRYGAYTERCSQLDGIIHTAGDLLPVWAAGNDRDVVAPVPPGDLPRYGPGRRYWDRPNQTWVLVPNSVPALYNGDAGGFDTMPPDSVSKNLLTVGAIEPMAEGADPFYAQVSSYSVFGPTDDGRIKPDLVAKGSSVLSSSFDAPGPEGPDYEMISGTSFAAPAITGSLGLILQHFGNLHGTNHHPWASTLKVLAIHTADDIAPLGPDFKTGWGLMNTERAVRLASSNALFGSRSHLKECALPQGGSIEFPLWVTNGAALLKATISWTDPAHTAMPESLDLTNSALVNDIDLRIVRPDGTTNLVWILNPDLVGKDPTVRSAAATYGDNYRDNVEQTIPIANPAPGLYRLLVTHKATLRDRLGNAIPFQHVSIAASGNTPLPKPELRLEILDLGSGQIGLSWDAVVGQRYRVQYKDDVAGTTWTDVAGDIIASKPRVAVALNISGAAQRFFRVVEVE